uniref:Pheromone n=1 Tax=Agrocybe salicacicola TaxID=1078488 RepID=A0A2P0M8C1_9AGAR|nr:pheromone precursor [Agrocybe salicacicola]
MDSFSIFDLLTFSATEPTPIPSSSAHTTETPSDSIPILSATASEWELESLADYEVRSGGGPTWFCVIA